MKTLIATSLIALGLFAGPANARDVWTGIADAAPRFGFGCAGSFGRALSASARFLTAVSARIVRCPVSAKSGRPYYSGSICLHVFSGVTYCPDQIAFWFAPKTAGEVRDERAKSPAA